MLKLLKSTPFGNDLLADFAKKAIEKEELGKDNITDFLTVSFSSTDYIGHILDQVLWKFKILICVWIKHC